MLVLTRHANQSIMIGNEVVVVWGDVGTRQKHIRATVERFPLYNEDRNEVIDVSAIPHLA